MYRAPSKRKQLIRRTFVYAFMSLAVIGLVAFLLLLIQGYQFSREDGRLEPGGLMQFNTQPGGAGVAVNGRQLGGRTPTKTTMVAGQHFVAMTKSGYHPWQKSVTLQPGAVLWLDYARLVPTTLTQENVVGFKNVASMATSSDARRVAILEDLAVPLLTLVDTSGETVKQSQLTIPADKVTTLGAGKSQQFAIEAWGDNRFILVRHTISDGTLEWLVVDTENAAQTVNISKLLGVSMSKVLFGANTNTLFVQIGQDVRKADIAAATLSRPLISSVAEFSLYDDRHSLAFTTVLNPETRSREVGFYKDGADKSVVVRSFTDDGSAPLHVAIGEYFSDNYLVIAYGETVEILKGQLRANDKPELVSVATYAQSGGVAFVENRTKGRFFVTQNGANVYAYDLELKQLHKTTLQGNQTTQTQLQWLDGYTAWNDTDGILRLFEFDGANQHDIVSVVPGKQAFLSRDGAYLYMITASDNKQHLSRVRLILP
jgi:hypothetical protein